MGSGRCRCCTTLKCISALIVVSVLFICLGAGSIPFLSKFYKNTVKKQLVLEYDNGGNEAYQNWADPPTTVYMQFYIFNYTNVDEIMSNKDKPNVTQLGPYSYREVRDNAILYQDDYEITYMENYTYVFDPATSCANCSVQDIVNVPNIAVITVLNKIKAIGITKDSNIFERAAMETLNTAFNNDPRYTMFMQLPVHKLLWGFTSPFLQHLDSLIPNIVKKFIPDLNINPFIALQQNGTAGAIANGNMTILTGKRNIDDVQRIIKWRNLSEAPYWNGKYGRMLNGTDGTRFKPFLSKKDIIYLFNAQLCRSLYLNYDRDTSMFDIPLYRFSTTERLFENHTGNPDNRAFCDPKGVCYGSGLLPVGQCQPGDPPVFMSSPHFYQGFPGLWQAINGLKPNKKLHETYLSVEPTTGIVMDAHKRLQININSQRVPFFTKTEVFPSEDNFLPMLFVHEFATIDSASAKKFKKEVVLPKTLIKVFEYGLVGLGSVFFIIALMLGAYYQRKKHNSEDSNYSQFDNPPDKQIQKT